MWKRLQRIFQLPTTDDPVFGTLVFDRSSRTWEGALTPPFASHTVGLTVDTDESGPTERHRDFYRDLCARFPELRRTIENVLLETVQNWDASIARDELWGRFALESMSIPNLSEEGMWELCYTLTGDPHHFCVMVNGWDVEGVRVDG